MTDDELLNEIYENSTKDFDEFSSELVSNILNEEIHILPSDIISIENYTEETSSSSLFDIDECQPNTSIGNSSSTETSALVLICGVCGAPAHGYNFDQITCESCKAFFRRNALKNPSNLKCRFDGNCAINMNSRRQCTHCRLKKCFAIKMRKEWIRTEEERQLTLLKKFTNQQKLSFDELQSIGRLPLVVRRKKRTRALITKDIKQELVSRIEPIYPIQTLAIHHNLSDNDRILLNNISNAYKIGADQADYSHFSRCTSKTTLTEFLNDETIMYESLIQFFKQIPEFRHHNLADQILLVKSNTLVAVHLHHIIIEDFHSPPEIHPHLSRWISPRFQQQMVQTREKYNLFMKYPLVLKIALIVFIFSIYLSAPRSMNQSMTNQNKEQIYESQNFYTFLLWRYLRYLFNEYEAIKAMLVIVTQILRFQTLMFIFEEVIYENGGQNEFNALMKSILRLN